VVSKPIEGVKKRLQLLGTGHVVLRGRRVPSAHRPVEASLRSLQMYAFSLPLIFYSTRKSYFREDHFKGGCRLSYGRNLFAEPLPNLQIPSHV